MDLFKLQISVLNNQVETLLKKLSHLEKSLSRESDLRQIAENRLREVIFLFLCLLFTNYSYTVLKELTLKSKLETEKLEVIAKLTNLKLVNVLLTKENVDLKEMLINQNKQNPFVSLKKMFVI